MIHRKGSIKDIFIFIIMIPVVVITLYFGFFMFNKIFSVLLEMDVLSPFVSQYFDKLQTAMMFFDFLPLLLLIGMTASSLYFASKIPANPIYMGLSILIGLFAVFLSGMMNEMWIQVIQIEPITQVSGMLTISTTLLSHLPKIIAVLVIAINAVMYKSSSGKAVGYR